MRNKIKKRIEPGAKLLNTNKIDFSNLVNTVDVEGVEVSAGLDSNLTLTTDENGGIYISARIDDNAITSSTNIGDIIGFNFGKVEPPFVASISVGKDAEITSDSDVTLSSIITVDRTTLNETASLSNFWGFESKLDVAGNIKAKNINLESTSSLQAYGTLTAKGDINVSSKHVAPTYEITSVTENL